MIVIEETLKEQYGFKCDKANNGEEAIEAVNKRKQGGNNNYKLILMDLNMPVVDGIEATRTIIEQWGQ